MSVPRKNKIDVSRYVSIGDSITSGYADGALYHEAQLNSCANLLAQQLKLIGGGTFTQALMPPDSVGVGFLGNARIVLKEERDCHGKVSNIVTYLAPVGDLGEFSRNLYGSHGPFNNMSVPGAKSTSLTARGYGNPANGLGNFNPFFTRIASNITSASLLSDALEQEPTFFSLFIGNNDVLAYALYGGTIDAITPVKGPAGIGFEQSISETINAFTSKNIDGLIASIPEITAIPYFTTIPYNGLALDKTDAAELNQRYKSSGLHFHPGNNPFIVEAAPGNRLMEKGEMVLLDIQFDKDRCDFLKGKKPIPKKYYLNTNEIAEIMSATKTYNYILKSIAREKSLAYVDVQALMPMAKKERMYNPKTLAIDYRPKGIFSLDGLHTNTLGNSLLANEFIRAMYAAYGTDIPKINFARFRGITLAD